MTRTTADVRMQKYVNAIVLAAQMRKGLPITVNQVREELKLTKDYARRFVVTLNEGIITRPISKEIRTKYYGSDEDLASDEFELFHLLADNPGRYVTNTKICEAINVNWLTRERRKTLHHIYLVVSRTREKGIPILNLNGYGYALDTREVLYNS